jgi:predicted DNA-binding transcriptional regulator AlpA
MSLEHHPARNATAATDHDGGLVHGPPDDPNFWHALINEKEAGDFLGLSDRAMQKMRQAGGGPRFIRISARCIRYRRIDLKTWADALMRSSTSDPDEAAA